MNLAEITPLILTFNEAPNLARCLNALGWAKRIVVLDSRSTDQTAAIAAEYPAVELRERQFDELAVQWNYGLTECGIRSEWVLALDADYLMSAEMVEEIRNVIPTDDTTAYRANFIYCVYGRPLRSGVYPPVAVLFRRGRCRFVQDGHAHRLVANEGRTVNLSTEMKHDDWKSVGRWIDSQSRYMDIEVRKLSASPRETLSRADRIRTKIFFAPFAVFFYCFFWRGGFRDGWAGCFYTFQRVAAELVLSLKLLEARYNRSGETRKASSAKERRSA